ncbi:MAG TPA: hydrogenase-4 subunit G [Leptospiraceae bacterium]|nr:hydrogenase-4 subunit G [Leptospiraceae bacterium]HMZ60245.1 hydrogenase-4 subunit G [Leptospiraceae bacterium]HNF12962.1 hydrogenase-4 subunit G [Leptospiraceae bacterium]HNI97921.1 hydrogenase-4 subunit G [Leptospiraceae bacterium]HNM02342.1 hydrogenase-4 subunit G [Leptospiraceae bacterium]
MGLLELKNLFSKHDTMDLDKASPVNKNARGIPVPVKSGCSACRDCENLCPTKAVRIISENRIEFNYGSCLQCGICTEVCSDSVLKNSGFNYVFALNRDDLTVCFTEGEFTPAESEIPDNVKIFRELSGKRGFNYREVAASGNNAVECELNASFNSVFDSEGHQFRSVASPKHADAVVYSGPVGINMQGPLQTAWDCMPEPKALIAAGTEAVSGGVFEKGKTPKEPDLFIGGDPPRPDVMINAFRFLSGVFPFSFQKELHSFLKSLRK